MDGHEGWSDAAGDTTARDYVTIKGFEVETTGGFGLSICGSYLIVEDCEFYASGEQVGPCVQFHYSHGSFEFGAQDSIIFRDNVFGDSYGEQLYIAGSDSGEASHTKVYIYDNTFDDGGTLGGEGNAIDVKAELRYVYIYGNTITDCNNHSIVSHTFDDIYIYRNSVSSGDIQGIYLNTGMGSGGDVAYIYYNKIYDHTANTRYGIVITTDNAAHAIDSVFIYNNTLNNCQNGIYIGSTGANDITNVFIRNNIVANSLNWGIRRYNWTGGKVGYNDVWNSTTANYNGYGDSTGVSGNISSDPKFIDASVYNFIPKSNSPCSNAGVNVSLSLDYAGNSVSDPPDIGAYEFSAGYEKRFKRFKDFPKFKRH